MGANSPQTPLAFREAEVYEGPALMLVHTRCIIWVLICINARHSDRR